MFVRAPTVGSRLRVEGVRLGLELGLFKTEDPSLVFMSLSRRCVPQGVTMAVVVAVLPRIVGIEVEVAVRDMAFGHSEGGIIISTEQDPP